MFDYERRALILRQEGFHHWEIFWLASHTINSPGMHEVRRDRRALLKELRTAWMAEGSGWWQKYQRYISEWYRDMGWQFMNGRKNPFQMLEWYKLQQGLPDTPQAKKRVKGKHFADAKERTAARRKVRR